MQNRLWIVLLIGGLVACTTLSIPVTSTPSAIVSAPTEMPVEDNLHEALSLMPAHANFVEFTNWALIKSETGFPGISSADDFEQRIDFLRTAIEKYPLPAAYGLIHMQGHSELWGWDLTDLEWEVRSSINIHPNYVLKFRDDFDFTPFLDHLKERGFKKTIYQDLPIYSHPVDTALDWIGTTELSIVNTAVIEDANLLVMSGDKDVVESILGIFQKQSDSLADNKFVQELIASLANSPGVFVSGDVCSLLGPQALMDRLAYEPLKDTKQRQLRRQLDSRPPLESYEALGIGYSLEDPETIGRIILQFSDPETALKDLEPRQQLAETGTTRQDESRSYREIFFTFRTARVEGDQIIMEVEDAHNGKLGIFEMVDLLDMSFATCP